MKRYVVALADNPTAIAMAGAGKITHFSYTFDGGSKVFWTCEVLQAYAAEWAAIATEVPMSRAGMYSEVVLLAQGVANIPDGWAHCDGTNGTPNLIANEIGSTIYIMKL